MGLIVNLSGGKDSTAMLHMLLEKGEDIEAVVHFDGGWEFPEMLEHINEVEEKTGIKIDRIKPEDSFDRWMFERPIKSGKDRPRQGIKKGEVHRIGYGWPSALRRWCTREKVNRLARYHSWFVNPVACIGFAFGESKRAFNMATKAYPVRYPLIEWKVTEPEALDYCKSLGYTWKGLYEIFERVSCFCCPLQSVKDFRLLRQHRPDLWERIKRMDVKNLKNNPNCKFRGEETAASLECRFEDELFDLMQELSETDYTRKKK